MRAGGLRVSRSEVEKFAAERKFRGFLETSAKKNLGCEELKLAILAGDEERFVLLAMHQTLAERGLLTG